MHDEAQGVDMSLDECLLLINIWISNISLSLSWKLHVKLFSVTSRNSSPSDPKAKLNPSKEQRK
jgi:hypothetical protein